jgi:hypothetical protein
MENADAGKYAHPGQWYALVQSESFQHLPCLNLQCHAQWLSHLSSKLLHSQYMMLLSSAPAWWENLSLVSSPFHHLHHTLCSCEYYSKRSKSFSECKGHLTTTWLLGNRKSSSWETTKQRQSEKTMILWSHTNTIVYKNLRTERLRVCRD